MQMNRFDSIETLIAYLKEYHPLLSLNIKALEMTLTEAGVTQEQYQAKLDQMKMLKKLES
jgi:hypothetical protein